MSVSADLRKFNIEMYRDIDNVSAYDRGRLSKNKVYTLTSDTAPVLKIYISSPCCLQVKKDSSNVKCYKYISKYAIVTRTTKRNKPERGIAECS